MDRDYVTKAFQSSLGQQCEELFSTPDDRLFIREEEAYRHCMDNNLDAGKIQMWFPEWSGNDELPQTRTI
jgi:hypothetical protein